MKHRFSTICLLVFACVMISLSGCNMINQSSYINLDNRKIHYIGRCIPELEKVALDNSCSGFEINVNAKKVSVTLEDLSSQGFRSSFALFIDGERLREFSLDSDKQQYELLNESDEGKHSIKLLKISEARFTNSNLTELHIDGKLLSPPQDKQHRIEFVGDSLTTGFGVLSSDPNDPYSPSQQDASQTYASRTAERLNAEYSVVAVSGWGIAIDCDGSPMGVLPVAYGFTNYFRNLDLWDFSISDPEIVVINLGTNDISSKIDNQLLKQSIVDFTKTVSHKNPNAKIVWCYGLASNQRIEDIEDAVKSCDSYGSEVYFISLPTMNVAEDGVGALYHPSIKAHIRAGDHLADEIKKLLNWS